MHKIIFDRTIHGKKVNLLFYIGSVMKNPRSFPKSRGVQLFILSSFHTLANVPFHRLPQTKGRGGGLREKAKCSVLCASPSHFFSALLQMDPSQVGKNLFHSFSPRKRVRCVCVYVCTCDLCVRLGKFIFNRHEDEVFKFHLMKNSP